MRLSQLALTLVLAMLGIQHNVQALVAPTLFPKRPSLMRLHSSSPKKQPSKESKRKPRSKKSTSPPIDTTRSPTSSTTETPQKTLGGGEGLIFAMARRMLVWEEKEENKKPKPVVLPRWHPHSGISDVNPSFRTQAPIMNNQGYAGIIWRNVRKRDKPSLWRHALRTYERMKGLEQSQKNGAALKIQRCTIHYEGALLACAKLALWQEALQIYKEATESEIKTVNQRASLRVQITDNMVMSLISACVRGCKKMNGGEATVKERRVPLDAVRDVLLKLEENHGLPLVSLHLNPLAAAYQSLGLMSDAAELLKTHLTDRTSGPEGEDGDDPFNINDVNAKDKASYALLVKGSVSTGDWAGAVEALRDMTEAGSYPSPRNLNAWTEVSERKTRQRNTRSRKKKRDEYWLDSVR